MLRGRLGRLMIGVTAFELGNAAATLLILRATDLFHPGRTQTAATQLSLILYALYNVAATAISVPAGANLAASALAGLLWTAVSPAAAFLFLTAAMVFVAPLIAASGRTRRPSPQTPGPVQPPR